jgi:hypothetical protein
MPRALRIDMKQSPRERNRRLAAHAITTLREIQPATLRQLYYRLISAGELANDQTQYKRLGRLMTRLRESAEVSRRWIVDHLRSTLKPSSWTGLDDFGQTVCKAYRRDFWASLPVAVELFVEKDAVAGTVQALAAEYDVPIRVCRGYASVSFAGEIADEWRRCQKPIVANYLGDFDPSGLDIERDLIAKLERYGGRECVRDTMPGPREFGWCRLGVLSGDFDAHNLIRLPVKRKDCRAASFIREHGTSCAEVDALSPVELRRRVRAAILSHIDPVRWERLREVERIERKGMQEYMAAMPQPNLGSLSEDHPS